MGGFFFCRQSVRRWGVSRRHAGVRWWRPGGGDCSSLFPTEPCGIFRCLEPISGHATSSTPLPLVGPSSYATAPGSKVSRNTGASSGANATSPIAAHGRLDLLANRPPSRGTRPGNPGGSPRGTSAPRDCYLHVRPRPHGGREVRVSDARRGRLPGIPRKPFGTAPPPLASRRTARNGTVHPQFHPIAGGPRLRTQRAGLLALCPAGYAHDSQDPVILSRLWSSPLTSEKLRELGFDCSRKSGVPVTPAIRKGGERTLPRDTGRRTCSLGSHTMWEPTACYPILMDRPMNLTKAAEHLGLAPSTVRARILAGKLEAERDGGRWVIYPDALKRYRAGRKFEVEKVGQESAEGRRQTPDPTPLTQTEKAVLEEAGIVWQ